MTATLKLVGLLSGLVASTTCYSQYLLSPQNLSHARDMEQVTRIEAGLARSWAAVHRGAMEALQKTAHPQSSDGIEDHIELPKAMVPSK